MKKFLTGLVSLLVMGGAFAQVDNTFTPSAKRTLDPSVGQPPANQFDPSKIIQGYTNALTLLGNEGRYGPAGYTEGYNFQTIARKCFPFKDDGTPITEAEKKQCYLEEAEYALRSGGAYSRTATSDFKDRALVPGPITRSTYYYVKTRVEQDPAVNQTLVNSARKLPPIGIFSTAVANAASAVPPCYFPTRGTYGDRYATIIPYEMAGTGTKKFLQVTSVPITWSPGVYRYTWSEAGVQKENFYSCLTVDQIYLMSDLVSGGNAYNFNAKSSGIFTLPQSVIDSRKGTNVGISKLAAQLMCLDNQQIGKSKITAPSTAQFETTLVDTGTLTGEYGSNTYNPYSTNDASYSSEDAFAKSGSLFYTLPPQICNTSNVTSFKITGYKLGVPQGTYETVPAVNESCRIMTTIVCRTNSFIP